MKRLFSRQMAVELDTVADELQTAVSGGGSWVPTMPGADIEVMPGLYGIPYEPPRKPIGNVTLGINEQ